MSVVELKNAQEQKAADDILKELEDCTADTREKVIHKMFDRFASEASDDGREKLSAAIEGLGKRRDIIHESETQLRRRLTKLERKLAAWEEIKAAAEGDLEMQRPANSKFHELLAAAKRQEIIFPSKESDDLASTVALDFGDIMGANVFLIRHDWHGALSGSKDYDEGEDAHFPYPVCCFEFQVSNLRICAMSWASDEWRRLTVFCKTNAGWALTSHSEVTALKARDLIGSEVTGIFDTVVYKLLLQIKAVCIVLEAEIGETEIVRAPHKLNRAREKRGELPVNDYHVINLARRSRAAPFARSDDERKKRSPRLHFRRGHWRHYEDHKTWIKWTLVGDPDLGFIDKHYRL